MRLERYISRLVDTINSRREIEVEHLLYDDTVEQGYGIFDARLRFPDGSILEVAETLAVEWRILVAKLRYGYHYQSADGQLVFRYDNPPHFPDLPNFPHHKHIGDRVKSATMPDLADVLREIDEILYGSGGKYN